MDSSSSYISALTDNSSFTVPPRSPRSPLFGNVRNENQQNLEMYY
jgi:hypothetical protein